jgi:pimeloyl-ACP methyl ester carboxylesterase
MDHLTVDGVRLECRIVDGDDPAVVYLHEGLGCVELWREYPWRIAELTGQRTVVYSRRGHGRSDPLESLRSPTFMNAEALVLAGLLDQLGIERPVLVGHSDGASIALIHAATADGVAGLITLAPHVFVEDEAVAGVREAKRRILEDDLAERMEKYHRDAHATFHAWAGVWLDPAFRLWRIDDRLGAIDCPVLVVQGQDDEYGTMAQVEAVRSGTSGPCDTLLLAECRHSPHLDRADAVTGATAGFIADLLAV